MKVAVACQSPLLQKSLELFLKEYLTSPKKCDILIRDELSFDDERTFYISTAPEADLIKPFSKSQLILALERRYGLKNLEIPSSLQEESVALDFDILQKRIESLTQEYQENILRVVKAFYEK